MKNWKAYIYGIFAAEISAFSQYYDRLIQYSPLKHDSGLLFKAIKCPQKIQVDDIQALSDLSNKQKERSVILLNGTLNHCYDIQGILDSLKSKLSRFSRIAIVAYNPYLKWLYSLANLMRIRNGEAPFTFVTYTVLENLCKISGYEITRSRSIGFFPFKWIFIGPLLNRFLPAIPFIKHFGLANIIILRPIIPEKKNPSLSIIIPARNEEKNIETALKRMPTFDGVEVEIIFVEGHSQDNTWEEIIRIKTAYGHRFNIHCYQQTGIGKNDAVNLGFMKATGELLAILDADLTMPPENLLRFYDIFCSGIADFINGSRLVYPMEDSAMRFLNRLGNVFFAKILSYILDIKLSDTLCGTKLLCQHDYSRILKWRKDFGHFDPFGDFELLFPAAALSFGIIDIPIRYMSRTYGDTNINRFYHGLMLFKMVLVGFFRIKIGRN